MNKETVYNELISSVHNSYLENTMFSCQVLRVHNLIETKINYLEISDTNTDLLTDLCNSLKTTADNYKSKLYAKTGIIPPST